jgi:hypothetical protein
MAVGLPVVATEKATQGLARDAAELVDTASTPQQFAEQVVKLLSNPLAARHRGLQGRTVIQASYSCDRSRTALLSLVDSTAAGSTTHNHGHAGASCVASA